jgi:two-component system NtrC family sensor kinase
VVIDPAVPAAARAMETAQKRDDLVLTWPEDTADPKPLVRQVHRELARRRAQQTADQRARGLARSSEAVSRIAVAVTGSLELRTILSTAADHAKELVNAEASAIFLVDEAKRELYFDVISGGSETVRSIRLRFDQGICGWVATHGEPTLCDSPADDPRFYQDIDCRTGFQTRGVAAVPLCVGEKVVGVLETINPAGRAAFDEKDLDALTSIAPFVAVAIQNAKITADLRFSQEAALASNERLDLAVRERTRQLQNAKSEIEGTFDAIEEPILFVGNYVIRRANMEFARRTGTPITAVPGKKCHELFAGRSEPCVGCPVAAGSQSPSDVAIGGKVYRVSYFPVRDTTAQVVHYRDVTEERALAAKLHESERMAAVGQLAAGAAHEINNPIGFITSNLATLKEVELAGGVARSGDAKRAGDLIAQIIDEAKRHHLYDDLMEGEQIVFESLQGTARISEIVRALKQLAREDIGQWEETDVAQCLDQAASMAAVTEHAKPPEWQHRDAGATRAHPKLLEQAFYQVVRNAIQAGPKSAVRLSTICLEKEILIAVTDEGSGMSDEVRSRALEPFFTTRGVGGGVGLGLTAAWGIVQRHGGRLEIDTAEGKGTTVRIRLPRS